MNTAHRHQYAALFVAMVIVAILLALIDRSYARAVARSNTRETAMLCHSSNSARKSTNQRLQYERLYLTELEVALTKRAQHLAQSGQRGLARDDVRLVQVADQYRHATVDIPMQRCRP